VAVSINLEEIVERAVPTSQGLYRVVRTEDFDALVAEVERLRAERHLDNADLAQAYDFARNKGEALEREAVVAYLRACDGESYDFADDIERGEHRRKEGL